MRIIGFILLVCLAIYALQLALLLLVLAGLIFRTKETLRIMLLFGTLGLISNYPIPCLAVGAAGVAFCLYKKRTEAAMPTAIVALTDETDG